MRYLLLFAMIIFLFPSCLKYREIVNFREGKGLEANQIDSIANYQQVRIQPDDILQINVFSYNIEEAARFNTINVQAQMQAQMQGGAGASLADPMGYRVDSKGEVDMPVIGKVKLNGMTIEEAQAFVSQKIGATGYLNDHNVQVRFLSFRITVLGEVNAPGTFTIPSQKITVLEAMGMARDLTLFANRDNILVIREKDNLRHYGRLNLKSKDIFYSPYYYLQPNDIVYVEPHKAKILAAPDPASRYLSIIVGVLSVATIIVTLSSRGGM